MRYVNSSNGMNIRDDAVGNIITHLAYGDLMYEIDPVPVPRALDGVTYYWLNVYFYKGHNTTMQGYGWVAQQYTLEVPSAPPSLSDTISSDAALPMHQSLLNARYIYQYLKNHGWSDNAIFGALGNMEDESYINPGQLEDANPTPQGGYGLVQWTPSTKYTESSQAGTTPGSIKNQLDRIIYEANNEIDWNSSLHSPAISYASFKTSTLSAETLSEYFTRCYERPGQLNICVPRRKTNATKWYTIFDELS